MSGARRALADAGWHPGRAVSVHMARAALIGAGQPAWPAALDVLAEFGGLRVGLREGWIDFDVVAVRDAGPAPPEDHALVGRLADGTPVSIDADGQIWLAGEGYADVFELLSVRA